MQLDENILIIAYRDADRVSRAVKEISVQRVAHTIREPHYRTLVA